MLYGETTIENRALKEYEKIAYSTPNLKRVEEFNLIKDYKEHGNNEAKQKIINAYLRTVLYQARKFGNRNMLPIIDLIHSGIVGICNALEEFKIEQYKKPGPLFAYFVYRGILMELTTFYRTFSRQFSVSDAANSKLNKINRLFKAGKLNLSIEDQKKYIGTHLSIANDEIETYLALFKPSVELDKEIDNDNSNGDSRTSEASEYKDLLLKTHNDQSPDSIIEEKDIYNSLSEQLDSLPADERNLLMYRYGINCTKHSVAEIAKKYNMSSANAGIQIKKIQGKLKRMMVRAE